jgi:surface antigen
MRITAVASLAILTLSLAACGPNAQKSDTGLASGAILGGLVGNQFGKGSGRVLGTMAGAVIGGVVGHDIGSQLDQRDRMLAQEAEFEAFESGEAGRPRRWRNAGNGRYGDIVPMERYRRGNYDCRDYTHTIYIDGRPQAMRGTACRNPDGTWRNVG